MFILSLKVYNVEMLAVRHTQMFQCMLPLCYRKLAHWNVIDSTTILQLLSLILIKVN